MVVREMPSSSSSAGRSSRGLISTKSATRDPPASARPGTPRSISFRPTSSAKRGEGQMAYSVPDLSYGFDALEPHIDARTMEIHHDKHHAAYVTNLNAALEGSEWMD